MRRHHQPVRTGCCWHLVLLLQAQRQQGQRRARAWQCLPEQRCRGRLLLVLRRLVQQQRVLPPQQQQVVQLGSPNRLLLLVVVLLGRLCQVLPGSLPACWVRQRPHRRSNRCCCLLLVREAWLLPAFRRGPGFVGVWRGHGRSSRDSRQRQ